MTRTWRIHISAGEDAAVVRDLAIEADSEADALRRLLRMIAPDDELLDSGQEEVFARHEVEAADPEHPAKT